MNNKILKIHKIDERYVLSERKFLYTFGYLCLEDELIKNKSMSKKQLYYFLEQRLEPASEYEVTLENVVTGKIILVGRGNNFRAYYRPIENIYTKYNECDRDYSEEECASSYDEPTNEEDLSHDSLKKLSTLIEEYYKNEFEEEGLIYLKAILERANISYRQEKMPLVHHARSKIKCYKKNLNRYIDK